MIFIDKTIIAVKAGDGGSGCIHFARAKYRPTGRPDGGHGGKGGDIIIQAERNLNTLADSSYQRSFVANNGTGGNGSLQKGKDGNSITIKVPVGTQIFDETGELIIKDLDEDGKSFIIAKGGKGGVGNSAFASSSNRSPKQKTLGEKGEGGNFMLVFKLKADICFIGLPNSGKSSIVASVSNAKLPISEEPCSTKNPALAIVKFYNDLKRITIMDLPPLEISAQHNLDDILFETESDSTTDSMLLNTLTNEDEISQTNDTVEDLFTESDENVFMNTSPFDDKINITEDINDDSENKTKLESIKGNYETKQIVTENTYDDEFECIYETEDGFVVDLDSNQNSSVDKESKNNKSIQNKKKAYQPPDGTTFLRHLERSNVIAYVINANSINPILDYLLLKNEIKKRPLLSKKNSVVIISKTDLVSVETVNQIVTEIKSIENNSYDSNLEEGTNSIKTQNITFDDSVLDHLQPEQVNIYSFSVLNDNTIKHILSSLENIAERFDLFDI